MTKMEKILTRVNKWCEFSSGYMGYPKSWFVESNRWKHFVGGAVIALFLTIFCAIGAGGGMEFKDCQWSGKWASWDWLDFLATISGGLVGQGLQILIVWLIFF